MKDEKIQIFNIFAIIILLIAITLTVCICYYIGKEEGYTLGYNKAVEYYEANFTSYSSLTNNSISLDNFVLTLSYDIHIDSNKYYYEQLSNNEKELYNQICEAIQVSKEKIDIVDLGLDKDSCNKVINAFMRDIYWLPTNSFSQNWEIKFIEETSMAMQIILPPYIDINFIELIKFEELTDKIIEEVQKQPTDYDKLKYIHDWIVNNTTPKEYTDTYLEPAYADGPIIKKIGNCSGYSRAFQYLAVAVGFECISVWGYADGSDVINHGWNMVKMNDGIWYNIDVCWADHSHLDDNEIYYDYFLKSNESFSIRHKPDEIFIYPDAYLNYS